MQSVLIVDDIADNLYFLEALLKGNGYDVIAANNGAEALESARSNPPDLIIADILMPVMDGYALCREWRSDVLLSQIPFIFYTATFIEKKDEELALSLKADRFVIKPQEPEILMNIIHEVLAAPCAFTEKDCASMASDEENILKGYNEALFRKLEKKMLDLEQVNQELNQTIADQKRLEEQLRQAQKMEAIGRFSAGIAHDFNNILTVILGYGAMIRKEMSSDNPQRDKMSQILKAAERAANLTRSLLTFSRKQELKLEQFDLNDTIRNVETFLRRVIGEDIKLIISLKEDNFRIAADKGHIEQVLMNLAANARDVMPEGGIFSISTDVIEMDETFINMHGYGAPGRYAVISVADTGVGMDETTRQRIFEPFFTTKETGRGTGLGLSIAYGIIQQHNGHIHVYSEPGQGTTFRVYLPLMQGDVHSSDLKTSLQNQMMPGGHETILVVDDEVSINNYLKMFLMDLGYVVLLARDGQEAIDIFRAKKDEIDLVLMDVVMPNVNGSDAATEIKRLSSKVKIIFTSGYPYDLINERKLVTESSQLLMKPLIPNELAVTLRTVFAMPD